MAYAGWARAMGSMIPGIGNLLRGVGGSDLAGVQYSDWNSVVKQVYMQHYALAYRSAMVAQLQQMQQQTGMQEMSVGKIVARDFNRDAYIVESEPSIWLHSRIERVRLRGREWLEGKRLKIKTTVDAMKLAAGTFKGVEESWEGSGIPVKRLKNGDLVWAGPPSEDYNKKWGLSGGTSNKFDWGGT